MVYGLMSRMVVARILHREVGCLRAKEEWWERVSTDIDNTKFCYCVV